MTDRHEGFMVGLTSGVLILGSLVMAASFGNNTELGTPVASDIITPKLSKIMHPDMGGYVILHYRWEDESGLICYGNSSAVDCERP